MSVSVFQTGYILPSERHFGVKSIMATFNHFEGSFQTRVLKTGHFKGALRNEGFQNSPKRKDGDCHYSAEEELESGYVAL